MQDKHPVPAFGTAPPSLPITSATYARSAELGAFLVRYVSANHTIENHCLLQNMANTIPTENIMPSSLKHGVFATPCPEQDALEYRPWPF